MAKEKKSQVQPWECPKCKSVKHIIADTDLGIMIVCGSDNCKTDGEMTWFPQFSVTFDVDRKTMQPKGKMAEQSIGKENEIPPKG